MIPAPTSGVPADAASASCTSPDDLIGLVSHELRTPLNAMVGWLHVLQTTELPEGVAARALAGLNRAVDQQRELVDALLEASRARRRDLPLEVHALALAPLLEQAVERRLQTLSARQLTVRVDAAPDLHVKADAERLLRLLDELLVHLARLRGDVRELCLRAEAVPGGVTLHLGLQDTDAAGTWQAFDDAAVSGADDGRPSLRQRGLTMGLVLARELLALQGGTLAVSEQGACLCIHLPA